MPQIPSAPQRYIAEWFLKISEAILLLAVFVAPINFGSTRQGAALLLAGLAAGVGLFWIIGLGLLRQRPQLPSVLVVLSGVFVLAALAWSCGVFVPTLPDAFALEHWGKISARWPTSLLQRTSSDEIAFYAGVWLMIFVVVDRSRQGRFLQRLIVSMVLAAAVTAVLAFAQNLTQAGAIFWQTPQKMVTHFCGPFFHHTAAGAFFNITWPLSLALAWQYRKNSRGWGWVFLGVGAFVLAAHTTHISRMPPVLAAVGLVALLLCLPPQGRPLKAKIVFGLIVLAVVAVFFAVFYRASKVEVVVNRWIQMSEKESTSPHPQPSLGSADQREDLIVPTQTHAIFGVRGEGWLTAVHAIQKRPLTGHGPANWMAASSQVATDPFIRTFFQYQQFVHNDFLQLWVEWGVVAGSILIWIWLYPVLAFFAHKKPNTAVAVGAWMALVLVLVQSLWDFPLQMPSIYLYAGLLAGVLWADAKSLGLEASLR